MAYFCFWKKNVQESKQLISNLSPLYFVAGFGYSAKSVDNKSKFCFVFFLSQETHSLLISEMRKRNSMWRAARGECSQADRLGKSPFKAEFPKKQQKQNTLTLLSFTNLGVRFPRYHNQFNNIFPAYLHLKSINISSDLSLFFSFINSPFLE